MVQKMTAWLTALAWGITAITAVAGEPTSRPNIVLIMADDLGWKDLHCYGNPSLDTPALDTLASQGVRFTNGYAAAPVCTPTRAAIMTGLSPARLGITNHAPGHEPGFHLPGSPLQEAAWQPYLALKRVTLAERLQDAGYTTAFLGKWHLSHRKGRDAKGLYEPQLRPEHQGFDLNVGGCDYGGPPSYFAPYRLPNLEAQADGEYLPERLADEAIAFVRAQPAEQPFFLCWWNYSVHYPFEAPEELIAKYRGRGKAGNENPTYSAMIEGMDRAIGRLLAALDARGLTNNTLVVFTSDNGPFAADVRPLRGEKGYLYEGGIRVPWIVRWPGVVPAETVSGEPIVSTDLFPTLLAAAGVERDAEETCDGVDLMPMLRGEATLPPRDLTFHYPNYAFHKRNRLGSALRRGDYKLIHFYDDDSVELYDLRHDLSEATNLAATLPNVAKELDAALRQQLIAEGANLPTRAARSEPGE